MEIFMISQLMTPLNNMMKSEKYHQDRVMIIQQVVYWILLILKKNYRLIAVDLSKQKVLDADPRAIQQIIFTSKIKSAVANTRVIILPFQTIKRNNTTIFKRNNKCSVNRTNG